MRQSLLLLRNLLVHGGLAAECVGPAGAGRVRLTLQSDGTTFLRCTEPLGLILDAAVSLMAGTTARIEAAFATVAATRTLIDVLVLGIAIFSAAVAFLSAGQGRAELWHPVLVFAAYVAFVPLREPMLRLVLRWVLRFAVEDGKMR